MASQTGRVYRKDCGGRVDRRVIAQSRRAVAVSEQRKLLAELHSLVELHCIVCGGIYTKGPTKRSRCNNCLSGKCKAGDRKHCVWCNKVVPFETFSMSVSASRNAEFAWGGFRTCSECQSRGLRADDFYIERLRTQDNERVRELLALLDLNV